MRRSRTRFGAGRFGLAIRHWNEEPEAEVAGKTECKGATDRLREAHLQKTAEGVGLREAALATEAVEVQRSQSAAAVFNRRQFADVHDLRQTRAASVPLPPYLTDNRHCDGFRRAHLG